MLVVQHRPCLWTVLLVAVWSSTALAFSTAGLGAAVRSVAARPLRVASRRKATITCQAGGSVGASAVVDVESAPVEPFLSFPGVSDKLRPDDAVQLEGLLDQEKAATRKAAIALSEEELINLTKQFLNVQFGGAFGSNPKQLTFMDVAAPDFQFVAPVVGPLSREAFSEAFGSFKLGEAFPDGEPNYYNFHQDPFQPNRIFFATKFIGTNTGTIAGLLPATNKRVESPPQVQSCTFNSKGEVTKYTIGYVMDKEVGNTGGLGGAYGIFYAIGYGLPFPEGQPWTPSPGYFLLTRGGSVVTGIIKNLAKLVGQ